MSARFQSQRVVSTYLIVSFLDYFADMMLAVISVLLFQSQGLSGTLIFYTIASVWIVEGLLEVPTGVVADVFGRRVSVLASFIVRAIGYLLVFIASSPSLIIVGVLLAAAGGTLSSGALEAWAVDELGQKKQVNLDRLFGRARIAENIGLLSGVMAGAALGMLSLSLPFLFSSCSFMLAAFLCAAIMTETHRPMTFPTTTNTLLIQIFSSGRNVLVDSKNVLKTDRILVGLMLGTALIWLCRGIPGVQWTVYFEQVAGGSLLVLGIMRSANALLEIPLLLGIISLMKNYPMARRWVIIGGSVAAAIFLTTATLVASPFLAIGTYICFLLSIGICMPGIRAAFNERLDAKHRATVLSLASMFNSLFTGLGLLIAGSVVQELIHVRASWLFASLLLLTAGIFVGILANLSLRTILVRRQCPNI